MFAYCCSLSELLAWSTAVVIDVRTGIIHCSTDRTCSQHQVYVYTRHSRSRECNACTEGRTTESASYIIYMYRTVCNTRLRPRPGVSTRVTDILIYTWVCVAYTRYYRGSGHKQEQEAPLVLQQHETERKYCCCTQKSRRCIICTHYM